MAIGKTKHIFFMLLIIVALVFVGCSQNDSNKDSKSKNNPDQSDVKEVVKDNNELTIAVDASFISLDPHDSGDNLSFSAQKTLYEGLFQFNEEMRVVPALATDYTTNEEGTIYTFTLREGVKFHDGTDFNADAVKYNIDRLTDTSNQLRHNGTLSMVKNVRVIDEYKVEIELDEPYSVFINLLSVPAMSMISPTALAEKGKDISQHPVGTGQYKFEEWVHDDHLIVVKNEDYWNEGYPKLDRVTFKPVPENGSRIAMLKTGEADFIYPVPPELAQSVEGEDGIDIITNPSIYVQYLSMNMMKKPFDDIKVRKAINHAIDKEAFIKVVKGDYGVVADSVLSPTMEYYSKQDTMYEYDIEKARKLLEEAGYKDGFETVVWGKNNSSTIKAMEFIQQQLSQVGINVKVQPMEPGLLSESLFSVANKEDAEVELYFGGWSTGTGAALDVMQFLFHGDFSPPEGDNVAYYNNDKVNELFDKAYSSLDNEKSAAYFKEMQELIWEDAPWAFLGVEDTTIAQRDYVKGIYVLPDMKLSIQNAEIVK